MRKASAKSEKKALRQLVLLATLGSIMTVVFYSVYYYGQTNYHLRTKPIQSPQDVKVQVLESLSDRASGNAIYSPLKACLEQQILGQDCQSESINWDFAFTLACKTSNGAQDTLEMEMSERFSTLPPIRIEQKTGPVSLGFMIQQFRLPSPFILQSSGSQDNAPFKKYILANKDSVLNHAPASFNLKESQKQWVLESYSFDNQRLVACSWQPGEVPLTCLQRAEEVLKKGKSIDKPLLFPLVDFDLKQDLKPRNSEGTTELRIKQLIAPDVKSRSRTLALEEKPFIIQPPFLLGLWVDGATEPYLLITLEDQSFIVE